MKRVINGLQRFAEAAIRFVFGRILRINLNDKQMAGLMQFIKFGLVGVSNTVVSYVVYLISLYFFRLFSLFPETDYLLAQFFGFVISVLTSFFLNRRFVFHAEGEPWFRMLMKTYASYAFTGLFLNSLLAIVWVEWLKISKLIAPLLNLIISIPINFLLNKFWAFRKKKK